MSRPRILNVGQCGFDHGSLSRFLGRHFQAEVDSAATTSEALEDLHGGHFDLVLVNRILDADGSSGLDLIRELKADTGLAAIPIMLVSNYADAQDLAQELGAAPGFGKADLHTARSLERIEVALGLRTASA
jgi:two-component system chemotaxis response regulator CheY